MTSKPGMLKDSQFSYVRMGDFLSTQMQSNRSFGYGLFICRMRAAKGPVCSTFWLYSNCPSPAQASNTAQNWNWNEVDFEFVPYTQAPQAAYLSFDGNLPKPTVTTYAAMLNLGDPRSETIENAAVAWTQVARTDEEIARQMWAYYNTWMTAGSAGAPTGGTFILEDGVSGDMTDSLDFNASASDVQAALDQLNDGTGLFGVKGQYAVSVSSAGGPGSIASVLADATMVTEIDAGASTVTLSSASPVTCADATLNFTLTASGNLITGSATVNGFAALSAIAVGQSVYATGVPIDTTVQAINTASNSITLSNAATAAYTQQPLLFIGGTATGTLTAASAMVTDITLPAGVLVGQAVCAQTDQIVLSAGLVPQLVVGEIVTAANNPALLPSDTTITALDAVTNTVTLSNCAMQAAAGQNFNFTPAGSYSVTFTPPLPAEKPLIVHSAGLLPTGTLGKVVAGLSGTTVTALNVTIFQPSLQPRSSQTWWDLLVAQTGTGTAPAWPQATDWKYPLVTKAAPSSLSMDNAVALNFWRTPTGNTSVSVDLGSWGTIAHDGVLSSTPMAGSTLDGSFTAAVLNNEAYLFDTSEVFAPYDGFHTYTIAWSPTRMAQYIDAPNGGRDISKATPVAEFDLTGYPSIARSGPQAPGGEIPWISSEADMPIGNVTMNLANYVAFDAASTGPNPPVQVTGTLTANSTSITALSSCTGLFTGQGVTGAGVPENTTVLAVDATAQTVTLSAAAATSGTAVALTFFTIATLATTGTLIAGHPTISSVAAITSVAIGQVVSGTGVPAGATVTAVGATTVTLSANATASGTAVSLTFATFFNTSTTTGDVTQGSTTITGIADPAIVVPGQYVSGAGLPAGAQVKAVDGTSLTLNLAATTSGSAVALIFTTSQSGPGWSGPPPEDSFTGVDAYVQTIGWYPLQHGKSGKATDDFDLQSTEAMWLDFSDGSWSAAQFDAAFPRHFGILYAQDYTSAGGVPGFSPLRDSKSPLVVSWVTIPDGKNKLGVMQLSCMPSQAEPTRNFFVLFTSQSGSGVLSATNPLVRAVVRAPAIITCSAAASAGGTAMPMTFSATTTGSLATGMATVTGVADLSLVRPGQAIAGTGVPTGTTVIAADAKAGTLTMSAAATSGGTAAALSLSAMTTGTVTASTASVTLDAAFDVAPVVVGQSVTCAGFASGTTVTAIEEPYYAANSSVGPPTAFYAPPAGTSVNLAVDVWVNDKAHYPKGSVRPVPPDYTASITVQTSTRGTISWSPVSDPNQVLEKYDPNNPFRIVVTAPPSS
ncbi:hypothetical protein [Ferrovibrio xuzhouensis]|uniref:GH16 domain-containing protein n=1 Tax=Ferrovibrio xuzhouensis TaxID=1576914 RepID=A0ABV7VIS6_9PROT